MSTAPSPQAWGHGRVLMVAAGATLLIGGLLTVVGWALRGSAAGAGAAVGVGLVVTVLTLGSAAVDWVAGLIPAMSLLVAMMTYLLQVMALLLALVLITRSGMLESDLDQRWVGAGVVLATVSFLAVQAGVVVSMTRASLRTSEAV